MELSRKLKTLRKKQGFSQLELSEKLLVSRQAVSSWEAGTAKPSIENLRALSHLYKVSLEYLLDDEQELFFPASAEEATEAAEEKATAEAVEVKTEPQLIGSDVKRKQIQKWCNIVVFFLILSLCVVFFYD